MKSRHPTNPLIMSLLFLVTVVLPTQLYAQNSLDRGTPAEAKVGQSTPSTYAMDKIETVNLANGNFSMRIPLVTIGGRGSASYTVLLSYNSKVWSAEHEHVDGDVDPFGSPMPDYDHYFAYYDDQSMSRPGVLALGGGWALSTGPALKVEPIFINPHNCPTGPFFDDVCYDYVVTRMWLVLPDGSEIEMRDQLTDGAPYYSPSDYQHPRPDDRDRGRVWHSTDGSSITYVSDLNNGAVAGQLSGWVFFGDGTRLRMQADQYGPTAHCSRISDRNGNFVSFDYTASGVNYTDELGRQVIVSGDGQNTTVTVKGYSGLPDRVISIGSSMIGAADASGVLSNLRSDFRSYPRPFINDYLRTSDGDIPHSFSGPPRHSGGLASKLLGRLL